jgi:hypothetical protein
MLFMTYSVNITYLFLTKNRKMYEQEEQFLSVKHHFI